MGDKEKQRKYFEQLDANMPGFSDGTLELLVTYLDAGENDNAVKLVQTRSSTYKRSLKTSAKRFMLCILISRNNWVLLINEPVFGVKT